MHSGVRVYSCYPVLFIMFRWRLTTEMLHFFPWCCRGVDSFEHFAVLLGWILLEQNAPDFTSVPQLFSRGALHVTDFTLYSTASKYMLHNFQCSEDKVMNSIFPTKKGPKKFIFYCSLWKWDACADMGTWSREGLCALISPVPSARTMLLNFWLVLYLHFQIQNIATHAIYEKLESEPLLWDLDGIQTCRGNHPMLAISRTHTLHPHLSPHSTCVHRDTPQLALPTFWVCV